MHRILIISKDGTETMHYTRVQNATELYRPAGVRVSPSFCQCAVWPNTSFNNTDSNIELRIYGKAEGPERYANAYICPPPFEHIKLFGTCIVAQVEAGDILHDIDIDAWKSLRTTSPIEKLKTIDTTSIQPTISSSSIEPITSTTFNSNTTSISIAPEVIDTYLNCAIELNYEPYLPDI